MSRSRVVTARTTTLDIEEGRRWARPPFFFASADTMGGFTEQERVIAVRK